MVRFILKVFVKANVGWAANWRQLLLIAISQAVVVDQIGPELLSGRGLSCDLTAELLG